MPCFGGVCYRSSSRSPRPQARADAQPQRAARRPARRAPQTYGGRSYGLGKGTVAQVPIFEPAQREAQQNLLQMALAQFPQLLSGHLPTEGFEPIAQQARTQFQQETAPSLLERLNAMGASGAGARSNVMAGAEKDFESSLAAARTQYGQGQQQFLGGMLPMLLQAGLAPQYESSFMQPRAPAPFMPPAQSQSSLGRSAMDSLPAIIGALGGLFAGGPAGAAAGGTAGSALTKLR